MWRCACPGCNELSASEGTLSKKASGTQHTTHNTPAFALHVLVPRSTRCSLLCFCRLLHAPHAACCPAAASCRPLACQQPPPPAAAARRCPRGWDGPSPLPARSTPTTRRTASHSAGTRPARRIPGADKHRSCCAWQLRRSRWRSRRRRRRRPQRRLLMGLPPRWSR